MISHYRLLLLFIIPLFTNCGNQITSTEKEPEALFQNENVVTFEGREIDLTPYLEGFPYSGFTPVYSTGKLYYNKQGETIDLMEVDLAGNPDLASGKKISDIDFSSRNVWGIKYNENDNHLYWSGDEINDEIINLTRLNPETGVTQKLTDVPYVFGYNWNETKDQVAYVARLGDKEERLGEIRLLNLESLEETIVVQDEPKMRFTWGEPSWQPEGKGVVVTALKNADRTFGNLVYVDFETKEQIILTDQSKERFIPYPYSEWLDENTFLYQSNEDGFNNIYSYDLEAKRSTQLTSFTTDLGTSEIVTINGAKHLFATTSSPIETNIYLLSLPDGNIVMEQKSDVVLNVKDSDGDNLLVSATSNNSMFRLDELHFTTKDISSSTVIDVPQELKDKIYNYTVERVSYPTFDSVNGQLRKIHAYLYKPKNPLPEGDGIVMIQSFYGGGNRFSTRYQILADAGIHVLSPSPRGCDGFGKDFSALNDKDLGGNEIIDLFYAAKYVSEKLNVDPSNVGVFGGSHGGYATMRTLTFPGEVNGNKVEFDWGFGISHAGFSDIIHFYENCNIPDWVTQEAGNPKTESVKLNDRSPLYHADKMKGHLLLTHGTNDNRVPIAGSQMMADSLIKHSKNVTFVKFEGQGHGIKGLENTVRVYQTWFDFIENVVAKRTTAIPKMD